MLIRWRRFELVTVAAADRDLPPPAIAPNGATAAARGEHPATMPVGPWRSEVVPDHDEHEQDRRRRKDEGTTPPEEGRRCTLVRKNAAPEKDGRAGDLRTAGR